MDCALLERLVEDIVAQCAAEADAGVVASYIPELAQADPRLIGIAIATPDGSMISAGAADALFSLQSISSVFTLTLGLGRIGDQLWARFGREPSGTAYNSIVQLEREHGLPRNPFINAGAIALADLNLSQHRPKEAIGEFVRFLGFLADDMPIFIDRNIAQSELAASDRNRALAHFMRAFGNLDHNVDEVLGTYAHYCATVLDCRQLALAGRFLMRGGLTPNGRVISERRARRILSLMLTCGMYDESGDFAFRAGIPAKSGVAGGILAIVPGVASIAVRSPGLNGYGNSKLGVRVLQLLTERTGWSIFGIGRKRVPYTSSGQ